VKKNVLSMCMFDNMTITFVFISFLAALFLEKVTVQTRYKLLYPIYHKGLSLTKSKNPRDFFSRKAYIALFVSLLLRLNSCNVFSWYLIADSTVLIYIFCNALATIRILIHLFFVWNSLGVSSLGVSALWS